MKADGTEVATPIDYADIPDKAKGCPGMAPQNQTQANAAVGWNAEDSSQFALTDTTGSPVSSSGGYRTTYQTSPGTAAEFSYRNPLTEASVSGQKVQSFVQATFQIKVPDYAGGQVLTRSGVVIQMQNGDVFLRPRTDALESWDNIPAIQKITVASATPFDRDNRVRRGFRQCAGRVLRAWDHDPDRDRAGQRRESGHRRSRSDGRG